jgi:chromosome partitioning protein
LEKLKKQFKVLYSMAQSIAFLNMKGGVGKTTIAVNIAYYLSMKKKNRVLVIDLDPQYNATQYLTDIDKNPQYVNGENPTVFDVMCPKGFSYESILNGKKKQISKLVQLKEVLLPLWKKGDTKLDLIPGTIHLINLEMAGRGVEHRLQNFVKKIKGAYDYILVDCPPTFSIFLLSGFLACDYYLVPVKPDPLSVLGVPLLESVIQYYSENYEKIIEPLGVVFTMVRDTRMMSEVIGGLKQTSAGARYIFESYSRNSTYYAEASEKHIPLFEHYYATYYGHAKDMEKMTEELISLF